MASMRTLNLSRVACSVLPSRGVNTRLLDRCIQGVEEELRSTERHCCLGKCLGTGPRNNPSTSACRQQFQNSSGLEYGMLAMHVYRKRRGSDLKSELRYSTENGY